MTLEFRHSDVDSFRRHQLLEWDCWQPLCFHLQKDRQMKNLHELLSAVSKMVS